ncbi:MAG: hypothetical protein HBSAPP03_07620 [Phycisphaerae bacterium]|nr:MAG: hypothetical protein HBSAPP03_07620 [Phycisphaerae bacterium]
MPWWVVLIIAGAVAMDSLIVYALLSSFRAGTWGPMAKKFPPVAPAPGAVRREFESFSMGLFNLGWCVHVTVDDRHLHLDPAWLLRVAGAEPMSVPWSAVTLEQRGKRRGFVKAKLGTQAIRGPAWCLSLADPDAATGERRFR